MTRRDGVVRLEGAVEWTRAFARALAPRGCLRDADGK